MAARTSPDWTEDQLELGLQRFAQAVGFDAGQVARAVEAGLRRARNLQGASGLTLEEGRSAAYGVIARAFLMHAAACQRLPAGSRAVRLAAVTGNPPAPGEGQRLRAALVSLPPLERAVLLLVAVERLSYGQAASALGIGRVECAQLLAAARSGLALRLEPARARPNLRGKPQLTVVK